MHQKRKIFLLYMCATAVGLSLAFNIDVRGPEVYNGSADDFYGFKVLQVGSKNNKGIIVTAPLYKNGSGGVYLQKQNDKPLQFTAKAVTVGEEEIPVKHFGLSIAKAITQKELTVCSPNIVTRCYENSYMNSVCYTLTEQLQEQSDFRPAFQACTKKTVDLAFLFDGSLSMTGEEFEKNKDFIEDIMLNLKNTSIKFAAVQFSTEVRTVFTFNDYTNGTASSKLKNEPQFRGLTNTHKALDFVLTNHLNDTSNGGSSDATKVLVLITDGDPSDSDKGNKTSKKYDSMSITRFVIGVKNVDLAKLRVIASEPKDNNTFHIKNYNGLTGVLENFQKKIFQTEGTTAALAGDLKEEMAQTGFSAVYGKDALLLGSVGSQSWRGSLLELRGETESQIQDSEQEEDSYMGYSVSVGEKNKTALYFTGAPRSKHMGQVVLFTSTSGNWTPAQRINGEQHGSYFGAEVCSVDVDSDGNTDFLFVGAPLFYQMHRAAEGKIYIYRLTEELKLVKLFDITAHVMGRFGTTIASVADVNGDGLRDAAVGAPLEDQNRGAVYLYLGDRSSGIRSTHSQRILGESVNSRLQFFGQSIDGSSDAGNDGLPDIVVGSRGSVVVLKSKPVFNVTTRFTFEPHEISIDKIKCASKSDDFIPLVTLTICFEMVEATKSSAEAVKPGLNISYSLDVDPMRQTFRGFFNSTIKRRNLIETYELRDRETCFNRSVYMPKCVTDTLSPIKINMNFSQVESEKADVALNTDSDTEASVEVPFENRCLNNTCIAEIEVDFDFMTPSLLVADHNYFSMNVTLFNRGEDSYNTSLTIHHPPGLSFSRMTLDLDSKSRPLYSCNDYKDRTVCHVSLPVYRSQSQAKFMSVFHVIRDYEWKESLTVNITGHSDNQNSSKGSLVKVIPVQFEIKMVLLEGENSITYMNFTTEDPAPKRLLTKYTVDNYGERAFPVNVTIVFPTKLKHNLEINNYQVLVEQNTTQCRESDNESSSSEKKVAYCTPERECKYIVCDSFLLTNESVEFELSGEVQFKDLSQHNVPFLKRYTGDRDMVEFQSFLFVAYDPQKYSLDSYSQKIKREGPDDNRFWEDFDPSVKSSEVLIELIFLPDKMLIIVTGAGGGQFLILLFTVIIVKICSTSRTTAQYSLVPVRNQMESQTSAETGKYTAFDGLASPESKCDDFLDDQPRRNNLIFEGVCELTPERLEDTAVLIQHIISAKLKIDATAINIERAHRVEKTDNSENCPRSIIATFSNYKDRELVWKSRKMLRKTAPEMSLAEDVSEAVRQKKKGAPN